MAGYTRQSSYADGDIIDAADSNDEYNQLLAAFVNTTGHKHDGTAAEGPVIALIGDPGVVTPKNKVVVDDANNQVEVSIDVGGTSTEQFVIKDGVIEPTTDNDIDLGTTSKQFKDAHINGTANIDALVADTADINGGTVDGVVVGGSTAAAVTGTTVVANTSLNIAGDGATVTGIKDEDNMASNSATKLATQQSIKAYVDAQVTAQDLDFQGDTGGAQNVDLDSQTMTFTGGTGIDTTGSAQTMTVAIDSTVATLAGSQTLTNKTIDVDNNTVSNIEVDNLKSGVLDTDLSSVAATDTTLASAKAIKTYVDTQVTAQDLDFAGDSGGAQNVDLDSQSFTFTGGTGIDTTGSAQTMTFAIDSTVATLTGSQTLTNKTLTTPIIASISNTGTVTLPTSTDTLVGRATTDTLTNKTLTSAVLNGTISGTSIKDEDNMASDSASHLATQQSIKAYVDAEVAAIPTGDITSVVAGAGMTGGGVSGNVTLNVIGGTGITANADEITIDSTVATLSGTQTLTNKSIVATQLTGTVDNARLDAQLQDVAGLAVTDGNFIVGDGANFVAESGATARTSLGLGSAATLTAGTSANNAVQLDGSSRLPAVDGSQLTNLPAAGATAGFAVAMAIAL